VRALRNQQGTRERVRVRAMTERVVELTAVEVVRGRVCWRVVLPVELHGVRLMARTCRKTARVYRACFGTQDERLNVRALTLHPMSLNPPVDYGSFGKGLPVMVVTSKSVTAVALLGRVR
jgi:hypothetical protein